MRIALHTLCLMLLLAAGAAAQNAPPAQFRISLDLARFRGPDDSTASIELYYAVSQAGLTYRRDSAGFSGGIDMTVLVGGTVGGKDTMLYGDRWLVPSTVADTASIVRGMNLVGAYQFPLRAGDVAIKVIGRDRFDPARSDSLKVRVAVRPVGPGKTVLSDLELASSVSQSQKRSPFYKNTLEVIPNVGGVYDGHQPCFFYAEAYNLLNGKDTGDYRMKAAIYDAIGREVAAHERPKKRPAESAVLVDQFPLAALHSGTYMMVVSLLDSSSKTLTSASRKFFVLNTQMGVDSAMLAGSASVPLAIYAGMDEGELDEEFRQVKYESTDDERVQFTKLKGAEAKRKFMSAFWRHRSTGFRDAYMERVAYANQNYGSMGKKGYRTDRGRVHVIYGKPDDIERHPSESDSRPYEIWSYQNIQGGVIFVFVQRNTSGDYELVHSTHRNELHDEGWQRYLYPQ